MLLKTGAIYTLIYSRWKTNFKIYAFILFGNPIISKVHALNLGARQLTTIERAKLIHVIVKLSKIQNSNKYSGQMLYRILLAYCKKEVRKCYRTYFHHAIVGASILNYGLHKKEDFDALDYSVYNKHLYDFAKRDYIVTLLNLYSRRGLNVKHLQDTLAKINKSLPQQSSLVTQSTKTQPQQQTKEEKKQQQQQRQQQKPQFAQPQKTNKNTSGEGQQGGNTDFDKMGY